MKKHLLILSFVVLFISCNMNPNKEERIQKLETEIQRVTDRVNELENKLEILGGKNKQLETRVHELEQ